MKMGNLLLLNCLFLSFLIISCERNEITSSGNGARTRQADERHNRNEEQITAEDSDFEAVLWLGRISADSFENRGSAGQPTAVNDLKQTVAQLNYEHFAADSRVEGVIVTRQVFRGDKKSYKKIQVRHIPVINGVANIGGQPPMYLTPEILMKRIDLGGSPRG